MPALFLEGEDAQKGERDSRKGKQIHHSLACDSAKSKENRRQKKGEAFENAVHDERGDSVK